MCTADPLWPWLGPLPATLRYVCTSGFMDDVTFGRNGRDAERRRLHSAIAINDVAIPGWSLMSMSVCLYCIVL